MPEIVHRQGGFMKIVCHFCLKSASAVIEAPWGKGSADYVYHCPDHRDAAIGYIRSFSPPGRLVLRQKSLTPSDFERLCLCWDDPCTCELIDYENDTPLHEADGIPPSAPQGTQWVLFARIGHSSGSLYKECFYALPSGTWDIGSERGFVVGKRPRHLFSLDSNSDEIFCLPPGSWKWEEESQTWHPATEIHYDY